MKTKLGILLISLVLQSCASRGVDMPHDESIDAFKEVSKSCHSDNHCKLVDVGYSECGQYISMIYSKLSIRKSNRARLLHLASAEVAYQKKRYETDIQFQEICPAVMPVLAHASCQKRVCVKEYSRR